MAGDSAVVSKIRRPGFLPLGIGPLSLPQPTLVPVPEWGKGSSSATMAAPCLHCPVVPWALASLSCSGLFSATYSLPPFPSLSGASCWEPPPGVSRLLGVPLGSPPWEPGQPLSSQAPLSAWAAFPAPQAPRVSRVLLPSGGAASGPALGGAPHQGQVPRAWLPARRPRGGCGARLAAHWPGERRRCGGACAAATPGCLGAWLRRARGARAAPSPRRRSCWNGCAGWTGVASASAGATSTGNCAA